MFYAQWTLTFDDHFGESFKKVEVRENSMILFYLHINVALLWFIFNFVQSTILNHFEA